MLTDREAAAATLAAALGEGLKIIGARDVLPARLRERSSAGNG